ncbi:MAG: GHMP kinase [Candidatus Thorarchaeota archaeon]
MEPYCIEHGGCVINTTIDRHSYVSIKPREDNKIRIISIDLNKEIIFDAGDKDYSGDFELFKGTINVLNIKDGFDILTNSELPPGSGMGGSSSLAVALIGAFNEYYNLQLSNYEIALKAYHIERKELKQKGGYQDQFASVYGGFNFMEFSQEIRIIPLQLSNQIRNELHYNLILCYIGGTHISSEIQDEVLKGYKYERRSYLEVMQDLKDVAYSMRKIIESKDVRKLNDFGTLLHKGWLAKKSLSDKISNDDIDNFYLISRKFGVLGGKLLGAGGGGHLLLFSKPNEKFKVIRELEKIGGKIINFHFNPKGLEVWKVND